MLLQWRFSKMNDEIIFRRSLRAVGNSMGTTFPPELLEFINAKDGSTLFMTARIGKKGKGICIWTKKGDDDGSKNTGTIEE